MSRPTDATYLTRMGAHETNGVRELSDSAHDMALNSAKHLHALTCYMSALVADPDNQGDLRHERPIDTLNLEIVAGAFEALSFLAALSHFHISEAVSNPAVT